MRVYACVWNGYHNALALGDPMRLAHFEIT
jgi:hypothetical protein